MWLATHTVMDIVRREASGLVWRLHHSAEPRPGAAGRMRVLFGLPLAILAAAWMAMRRSAADGLLLVWAIVCWIVFAWDAPIAAGERFIGAVCAHPGNGRRRDRPARSVVQRGDVRGIGAAMWLFVWVCAMWLWATFDEPCGTDLHTMHPAPDATACALCQNADEAASTNIPALTPNARTPPAASRANRIRRNRSQVVPATNAHERFDNELRVLRYLDSGVRFRAARPGLRSGTGARHQQLRGTVEHIGEEQIREPVSRAQSVRRTARGSVYATSLIAPPTAGSA